MLWKLWGGGAVWKSSCSSYVKQLAVSNTCWSKSNIVNFYFIMGEVDSICHRIVRLMWKVRFNSTTCIITVGLTTWIDSHLATEMNIWKGFIKAFGKGEMAFVQLIIWLLIVKALPKAVVWILNFNVSSVREIGQEEGDLTDCPKLWCLLGG